MDRTDGTAYLIFIVDDGEPGNQGDVHQWRHAQAFEVAGGSCSNFGSLGHTLNPVAIESGNYISYSPAA